MSLHPSFRIPKSFVNRSHSGQYRASIRKRRRQIERQKALAREASERGISIPVLLLEQYAPIKTYLATLEADRAATRRRLLQEEVEYSRRYPRVSRYSY